jgi:hypothetical protein
MDKALLEAIQRDDTGAGVRGAPGPSLLGLNAGPQSATPDASAYGLDATGDFDLADVDASHVLALQQRLEEDPEGVLREARALWDSEISELELRDALEKTRSFIEQPELAATALRSFQALETVVGMPAGFGFEGYDEARIPISPMETKFESLADAAGYAATFVAAKLTNAFKPKPPFPQHTAARPFVYDYPDAPATVGVLADFGNGLAHSRYIAKHLQTTKLDHLLYLGDVYYCGTSSEFARFVAPEVEPFLTGNVAHGNKVNVLMLNSNHEMFSKGYSYFSYMNYRRAKGNPQVQEGSYFALRFGDGIQLIGIDTDYHRSARLGDGTQIPWLRQRLAEGRARGAFNILVSANEPFAYGKDGTTKLFDDLRPFLPSVDLWLWGNTHYCGLFDRTAELPISSCLGHGGYPYKLSEYKLDKNPYLAPCPASPLFLETRPRYQGTTLRPDVGNNGYAVMTLEPANHRVRIEYVDWMKRPRYRAVIGRGADGRGALLEGQELP